MHDHIMTVVGRYNRRIGGWDVVNEALNEDGTMRQSPRYRVIGDDLIVKAFQFAHEADPSAQLYYNEYSLENKAKRRGAVELMRKLKGGSDHWNVKIDGPDAKTEARCRTSSWGVRCFSCRPATQKNLSLLLSGLCNDARFLCSNCDRSEETCRN